MAIRACEQTILDMTAAYAGMANRGVFFTQPVRKSVDKR